MQNITTANKDIGKFFYVEIEVFGFEQYMAKLNAYDLITIPYALESPALRSF